MSYPQNPYSLNYAAAGREAREVAIMQQYASPPPIVNQQVAPPSNQQQIE
jgi:hypothetical protein